LGIDIFIPGLKKKKVCGSLVRAAKDHILN
jgi:hypothetical protein